MAILSVAPGLGALVVLLLVSVGVVKIVSVLVIPCFSFSP